MNPSPESENYSSQSQDFILDAEIIAENSDLPPDNPDLDLVFLEPEPSTSEDTPSLVIRLTPWGLGAIALFLFSNLLLTWTYFTGDDSPEMVENSPENLSVPEFNPLTSPQAQSNLDVDRLSTLSEANQPSPIPAPPVPSQSSPPVNPANSAPPPPSLSEKLLPPSLRPQSVPVTQRQTIPAPPNLPTTVVPISRPPQTALPQPQGIPAPPPLSNPSLETSLAPNPPELSKDDQLRNILRQQIVREEANIAPEQSFNQRVREKMLEHKMREFRAAQEAQAAQQAQQGQPAPPTANNGVTPPPPPPRSQTSATVPPAPTIAPQPTQPKPSNVNDLVNTLESFNQP